MPASWLFSFQLINITKDSYIQDGYYGIYVIPICYSREDDS